MKLRELYKEFKALPNTLRVPEHIPSHDKTVESIRTKLFQEDVITGLPRWSSPLVLDANIGGLEMTRNTIV